MSKINLNIANVSGTANVSIKSSLDNIERCQANCSNLVNGTHEIQADITKGITYTLYLMSGNCSQSKSLCCPAYGGEIVGNATPLANSSQTYIIQNIDGNYAIVGQNNGWNISGSSNNTTSITISNVGSVPFTLKYTIKSCDGFPGGGLREIILNIVPQAAQCTLDIVSATIIC